MTDGKQLLLDSRPFAVEHRLTSWWCLLSTLSLYIGLQTLIALSDVLALRIAASILAGLIMVRLFILYHDYEHGTILKKSFFAGVILKTYGILSLNPPSIWKRSHDHHHKHNAKINAPGIGSFPIMTQREFLAASRLQRIAYIAQRHPLTFVFGYVTVFLYGMCIRSLINNPRLHYDSAIALIVHVGVIVLTLSFGVDLFLLALIVPAIVSAMMGSYLFYAQHNFPDAQLVPPDDWDYVTAALRSSSYMKTSRVMAWITGNIGYHHVHHLNHHIPFYRLPEAMAALPPLQSPGTTTLRPKDILACLRLGVWDEDAKRMAPYPKVPAAVRDALA